MSPTIDILYDIEENIQTRFISFMGENARHDLAIMRTNNFYGKKLVLNLQSNRTAIIGQEDLREEGYLEFAFNISHEEANELLEFLSSVI